MPQTRVDLTSQTFGRLTVLAPAGYDRSRGGSLWSCRCTCGRRVDVSGKTLRRGEKKSCGCLQAQQCTPRARPPKPTPPPRKVAAWRHPMFSRWRNMHRRCYDPKHHKYPQYGARGIRIDERWHIFENFVSDMGLPPSVHHTLDRVDNNGNYSAQNCRWATPEEQIRNRRCPCCGAEPEHQRKGVNVIQT